MKIAELWHSLEVEATGLSSEGYLTRRVFPAGERDLKLAIETPSGSRMLMLRVRRNSSVQNLIFPKSSGFEVKRQVLPDDGPDYVTIQLVLKNQRFRDVFTALVQDVAEFITLVPVERDAIYAMVSRLRRWQLFLEQSSPDGLSEECQHGLYGELWVLQHIIIPQVGTTGVKYWTGSSGAAQDFQFPEYAIEVKTTVAQKPQKLFVSSEHQLDDSSGKEIVLLHLAVNLKPDAGETLPELIKDLRSSWNENPVFERLLFDAGYLDIHAQKYVYQRYSDQIATFYRVKSDFPRLIPAMLPVGVVEVRYAIQLSRCRSFVLSLADVLSRVRLFKVQGNENG